MTASASPTTATARKAETGNRELQYPWDDRIPAPAQMIEVGPGVHWVRMPLPFALDHINLWVLEDGDGWTLVDTGVNSREIMELWEAMFPTVLAGRPIRRIVVTHYHADHVGLAGWHCRRAGVPLWMTEGEYLSALAVYYEMPGHHRDAMFDQFRGHGLEQRRIEGMKTFAGAYRRLITDLPDHFHRIMGGETIRIGAHDWKVIAGYGHAPEHASLHCEALGLLIAGDMILPRISTNIAVRPVEPDGNPLKRFLDSIDRIAGLLPADVLVLPSHGLPFRGLPVRVAQLKQHHAERLSELRTACPELRTARDLVPVLFRRNLDDRGWYFGMGECLAHLNYLMHEGALTRVRGDDGVMRFIAA